MILRRTRARLRTLALSGLVPAVALGGALTAPAEAQRIQPDFWGMGAAEWSSSAPSVPVGAANFTTAGVYWKHIEPTPPQALTGVRTYDWRRLDAQVAGAEARRARPMIVMGSAPRHASTRSDSAEFDDHMPHLDAWRAYVRALATRYGTRLDYQIWPEPNISGNWKGSPAQMAELTVAASRLIREVAPTARIVAPAVAMRLAAQRTWAYRYFTELKRLGGGRVDGIVDVVALDPFPARTGTPEDGVELITMVRNELRRIGVSGVSYWTNEINYGVAGANQPTGVRYGTALQQSYVIRTYVLHAAARMQRVYWHLWTRSTELGVHMTSSTGAATPAAAAYSRVRAWLDGTSFGTCSTMGNGVKVCTARKGSGASAEVRRIYWRPTGSAIVKTHRSTFRRQLQTGTTSRRKGTYPVRIDFRPQLVVSRK